MDPLQTAKFYILIFLSSIGQTLEYLFFLCFKAIVNAST